ncbi:MAG: imidazolonepropionase [Ignavibacteria bacterium]|nr:imidazolonepropionase [Ignavibacteria bacterium]
MNPILLKDISNLVTCCHFDTSPKKGKSLNDIGLVNNGAVLINNSRILYSGKMDKLGYFLKKYKIPASEISEIDCSKKTVLPGFVDCHTHFVFSGSRANEYEMRISGKTYEQIAKSGGGISATVNSVRKTALKKLKEITERRLTNFLKYGTTTIEGKSGYGLDLSNEIKMLKVINDLNKNNIYGLDLIPTFLGAHSIPAERTKKDYIEYIIREMIPAVSKKQLAVFIDVFCERNYFSAEETEKILFEGKNFGLLPKLHTDQFYSTGGIEAAINTACVSVDHLEVINDKDINKLRDKNIVAVMLPGVSYFLDIKYAPARKLIEKNVPVALATDFNPGSCMTENMQIIMSLASLKLKMTAEEIINSVTINPAFALQMQNKTGSIQQGKQADLIIFDFDSYKELIYHFGVNQLLTVMKKGKVYKTSDLG